MMRDWCYKKLILLQLTRCLQTNGIHIIYMSNNRDFFILQTMVTNKVLAKIALVGGVVALGSATFFRWKIESGIKRSEYFRLAIEKLTENQAATAVLGKPVLIGSLDLGDTTKNFCDGLEAQFHVPVRGPKSSGIMIFEASRNPPSEPEWRLNTLELMDKAATKKLVIQSRAKLEVDDWKNNEREKLKSQIKFVITRTRSIFFVLFFFRGGTRLREFIIGYPNRCYCTHGWFLFVS